jgi:tetratricopeptide (TPR) repeat protein/tRNA A-37 threonylcarbamoyl transferase component Bud32
MGLVFVAEQHHPVKRRVALKIIKPGMDSRHVIARFEAERQALAMMDHANIAKVHNGGTTPEGRPYFVMELVKGKPITEYCNLRRLTTRDRLKLFMDVCHAVQHAHQKGIIHRDIKPSNVLVTLLDEAPVVKVIDFGIAKAVGVQLTDKTIYTAYAQLVGTPPYMSPEQPGLSNMDVDTRSDVYSLGVLLYELLTGATPFASNTLKKAGYDEMRRIIREDQPPRPSARFSTMQQAHLSTIAEQRGLEPRHLSRHLRGELDWIVMRALEKDRNRRYESASALAADIQRYLDDDPVEACPPSKVYRLRKFIRRNHVVMTTTGIVAGAILIGAIVSIWQAGEAQLARKTAEQERDAARLQRKYARKAVDKMYTQVAEEWLITQPGMGKLRMEFLRDALEYYRQFAQESGTTPEEQFESALAYQRVGRILFYYLRQSDEARDALKASYAILEKLREESPGEPTYMDALANTLMIQGYVGGNGELTGEELQSRAVALWDKARVEAPDEPKYLLNLAGGLNNLADGMKDRKPEEADRLFGRAIEVLQEYHVRVSPTPRSLSALSGLYSGRSNILEVGARLSDAIEERRKAIEVVRPLTGNGELIPKYQAGFQPWNWLNLGKEFKDLARLLRRTGMNDEARKSMQSAIRIHERLAADFPESPVYAKDVKTDYWELGLVEQGCGNTLEADKAFRQCLQLSEQLMQQQVGDVLPETIHFLLRCPNPKLRNPIRAAHLAGEWASRDPRCLEALQYFALAMYQNGNYKEAQNAHDKIRRIKPNGLPAADFLQAMIHWQLGEREKARQCYADVAARLTRSPSGDEELSIVRAEAATLLELKDAALMLGEAALPMH